MVRMIQRTLWCFAVLFPLTGYSMTSEEMEIQRLKDNMIRMQNDLNMLQSHTYKQLPSVSKNFNDLKGQAKIEAYIADMEERLRLMNGKMEEVQHQMTLVSKKNDELSVNVLDRLATLETKLQQSVATVGVESPVAVGFAQSNNNDKPVEGAATPLIPTEVTPTTNPVIGGLTASTQYENAFSLLRQSKYAEAEQALRQFIDQNPENGLVENAYYWLGETYYVRDNFSQAGIIFMEGYQKYPQGNKAIDNLFKLAMTLERMDKKPEACTTLRKLLTEFPKMTADIKDRVSGEQKQLGCS